MYRQLSYIIFLSSTILQVHAAATCTDSCPPCWTAYGDNCYRLFAKARTWVEAEGECHLFGSPNGLGVAYLVTLHSPLEEEFVLNIAKSSLAMTERIWLGFDDKVQEGKFEWGDEKPADYLNWGDNEPNDQYGEDCAALYLRNNKWNDLPCSKPNVKSMFMCKMRRV